MTLEFPEKILPFGRAGRREREFDARSSHGFGAKRTLFSLDSFFRRFPAAAGEFSTVSPNPVESSSDLFRFVSYLIRSCAIQIIRLTV